MFNISRLKIVVLILAVILLSCILSGCDVFADKNVIYDNDSRILQNGDSYSFVNRVGNSNEKSMDIKYSKFSGVQTVFTIEPQNEDVIKLNYNSSVDSGDFKIVLTTPDNKVIKISENSAQGAYEIDATKGKYKVKIVGRNTSGSIKMDLS